jgi:hypothetical protein
MRSLLCEIGRKRFLVRLGASALYQLLQKPPLFSEVIIAGRLSLEEFH